MSDQDGPEPTLAGHEATMQMPGEGAGSGEKALAEIRGWGERRERGLHVLRKFAALLARHGIIGSGTNRTARSLVVARCFAIATKRGLDMTDYKYLDGRSGPLAALMVIDLHAVELDAAIPTGSLFPDADAERAFVEDVRGKSCPELGRLVRDVVIPELERMTLE
ncbi:MAG: hypothetical protein OXU86_04805 [Thaumarchaeota archaeon]|nr:hypothetical protein [Nitrososphaerota archaeon]MDD9826071.1 hypothetical protein [Nitrososphaerota archaeon]MDD9843080.1 hypothetical protein [Nitrososphaerota archaeon]